MVGKVLAQFQICEKLGEGGMGVVWKARDTHLDRFVALKTLPAEKLSDLDRKRRSVQEAKAASALNHPNIVHIYDIAEADGVQFISMEYVPGKTLDQLIGRKGLRLNQALKYAVQIADALAQAHAAGIIHRDLKPSNIIVGENGHVKVLDFGLAKLTEVTTGEFGATATMRAPDGPRTEEGAIFGTVAYMSPEQAEGKKVDARSDIFSFGSMLYEMVTGRQAFHGDSKLSTLSAILKEDPKPVSAVAVDIPRDLERIITRSLRKDPARRFQHMADVKVALEELKEESDSGNLSAPVRRHSRVISRVATPLLAVLAVVGIIWWLTHSPKPVPVPTLTRLTWDSGLTTDPAFSGDGKLLAYASDRSGEGHLDIYVQQVGGGEPLRLTQGPGDKRQPAFSPDGTSIVFHSEQDGGVYVVSTLGGMGRKLAREGLNPQFSPDGHWVAYWVGGSGGANLSVRNLCKIYIVPSIAGAPRRLQSEFAAGAHPIWSPDGNHLLFLGNRDEKLSPEGSIDWWVTPLTSGPATNTGVLRATRRAKLTGDLPTYPWVVAALAWEPNGKGLTFSARSGDTTNLWRTAISPKTWKVMGPPQRLTSGPMREESPSVASGIGGTIRAAFAGVSDNLSIWSLPIKTNEGKILGEPQRFSEGAGGEYQPALSRDGKRMIYVSVRAGNQEVWIKDLRSGERSALTASRSVKFLPRFSPDGSKVIFSESPSWNNYIVPATGGTPELIGEGAGEASDWSPDGRWIIGNTLDGRPWILDVASRRKTDLLATRRWINTDNFSPDGHSFSFFDGTSQRCYIAPYQGKLPIGEDSWISIVDGENRAWSPDGNLLYVISAVDGHTCIWAQRLHPSTKRPVGTPFAIFHSHNARISLEYPAEHAVDVAGGRMVFAMGERTGNIWMAEWNER